MASSRVVSLSVVAAFTVAGAVALWIELMMREAAVYVIVAMLPLAFAIGAGAEMRAPMARAVIGGLITSTLLTLVVVYPVAYLVPGSDNGSYEDPWDSLAMIVNSRWLQV